LCEISKYLRINFGKSLRSYRTRNQYDSKRCQQCSRAKSMDTKGWICCHSCRNEYCAKCCKEGHCQQTLIAINRNSKNANIYPNLWNHCARCDSLDNCAFTNGWATLRCMNVVKNVNSEGLSCCLVFTVGLPLSPGDSRDFCHKRLTKVEAVLFHCINYY